MENEKCPVCCCPMVEFYLGWKCPTGNCGFRCSKNSLRRIAAAMELARATTAYFSDGGEAAKPLLQEAGQRVLEVFGGE